MNRELSNTAELEHVAATCAAYHLRRAMRAVNQHYDLFIRESGLRATQFTLVAAIALEGPITISALADTLAMDRTTLTRNLKPLERDGLVQLTEGIDRRTRMVVITPEGEEAAAKALPLWQEAQATILDSWGHQRFEQLLAELSAMEEVSEEKT